MHEIDLPQGRLRYRERGRGEPVVFLHGLLVNGDLWRKVVPRLAERYRCIVPDLPLGSHEVAMRPDADLGIGSLARLVADFLVALDLRNATLVANDTAGAITQVVITEHPENVARVVLTPCDCYDNFLPAMFRPLQLLAHVPPLLTFLLQPLRLHAVRRLPFALGWLAKKPIDASVERGYAAPILSSRAIRRDCYKVLRDISPRYTMRAAEKLAAFDRPALVVWAAEDRFFPPDHGRRLAATMPRARFELVRDSYTFVSEDQPEELSRLILAFLAETSAASPAAAGARGA
jgi:pimeloyl-ACP methyl ester carboxylesterase